MKLEFHNLPEAVRLKAEWVGRAGRDWLDNLPGIVGALAERWHLAPQAVLPGGSESLILAVEGRDGTPAVLKIGLPGACDCGREARILQLADGAGYVRLFAHDTQHNALLLERLGMPLADSGLSIGQQIDVLCATLRRSWIRIDLSPPLVTGSAKAASLAEWSETTWHALGRPCSQQTIELALAYAAERAAAFDPSSSVLVHGDAHAHNTLLAQDGSYRFVDPDGLLAEPALDLAVPMRGWNEELLAGDALALGLARCRTLAALSGADERAIWQWGFMERVSTGLLLLRIGLAEEGRQTLAIADLWSQ